MPFIFAPIFFPFFPFFLFLFFPVFFFIIIIIIIFFFLSLRLAGIMDPLTINCIYAMVVMELDELEDQSGDFVSPGDLLFSHGSPELRSDILKSLLAIIHRDFSGFEEEDAYNNKVDCIEKALRCMVPNKDARLLASVVTAVFMFPDKSILQDLFMIVIRQAIRLLPGSIREKIKQVISFGESALRSLKKAKSVAIKVVRRRRRR